MLSIATVGVVPEFYKFSFPNDVVIEVPNRIVELFTTLSNMLDFGSNSEEARIPIPLPDWVEAKEFQWAVHAELIMEIRRKEGIAVETLEDLYKDIKTYNSIVVSFHPEDKPLLVLFGEENVADLPTREDLQKLFRLAMVLDWLAADPLLKLVMNKVYQLVNALTTEELSMLTILMTRKRKAETKISSCGEYLSLTPFYEREELIRDFLQLNLNCTLVKANKADQKHIDPIAIFDDKILFLTKNGLLETYDWLTLLSVKSQILPPPGRVLLIANGLGFGLCLTSTGLYIYGKYTSSERFNEWTPIVVEGEVLLIGAGYFHIIVLTTKGLYGSGENHLGQLGIRPNNTKNNYYPNLTKITDINSDEVRHIYCGPRCTFVVTTRAIYAAGDNRKNQLSINRTADTTYQFNPVINVNLTSSLRIAPCENYTLFVTNEGVFGVGEGNNYVFGDDTENDRPILRQLKLPDDIGTVVNAYCQSDFSIIRTVDALYATGRNQYGQLATGNKNTNRTFVKMLGVEGIVYLVKPIYGAVLIYTNTGLYQSGKSIALPFVGNFRHNDYAMIFKKIDIDMGYCNKPCLDIIEIEDEEKTGEPQRKIQRFQCNYCSGDSHYFTGHFTVCSKTCLVNLTQ